MLIALIADVGAADAGRFREYEREVLAVLPEYGELRTRVRSLDDGGRTEVHLVFFPDAAAFERYRADPRRAAAQHLLDGAEITQRVIRVEEVPG